MWWNPLRVFGKCFLTLSDPCDNFFFFLLFFPLLFSNQQWKSWLFAALGESQCLLLPLQITSFLMLAFSLFSHGYLHDHEEVNGHPHTGAATNSHSLLLSRNDCKMGFWPLRKSDQLFRIGKLKLQNARVPLSVIVKLSYEMIYELMSFTPTCVPVELNQCLHHTGTKFSNSDPDFLQNIQILSAKVSSRTCEIKVFSAGILSVSPKIFLFCGSRCSQTHLPCTFYRAPFPEIWQYSAWF